MEKYTTGIEVVCWVRNTSCWVQSNIPTVGKRQCTTCSVGCHGCGQDTNNHQIHFKTVRTSEETRALTRRAERDGLSTHHAEFNPVTLTTRDNTVWCGQENVLNRCHEVIPWLVSQDTTQDVPAPVQKLPTAMTVSARQRAVLHGCPKRHTQKACRHTGVFPYNMTRLMSCTACWSLHLTCQPCGSILELALLLPTTYVLVQKSIKMPATHFTLKGCAEVCGHLATHTSKKRREDRNSGKEHIQLGQLLFNGLATLQGIPSISNKA